MKLSHDSFAGRLLMALAVYAALVCGWMHAPASPSGAPAPAHGVAAAAHAR